MSKQTTILIVDDDHLTRQTLSFALQDDYGTVTAKDGKDALDVLQREDISLVLSDLFMPGMSGIELLEQLNTLPETPPVITTSAPTM